MIIAIDIGNTNIVLGCLEPDTGRLLFTARLSSDRVKTSDEYAALMRNMFILNQVERHDIEGSIISSVVPTLTVTMKQDEADPYTDEVQTDDQAEDAGE